MGAPLLFAVSLSPRLCHLLSDSTADRHSKMNSYSADWATKLYDLAHVHGPYLAASTIIWTPIYLRVSATYRGLPFKLKMQWDNRIVAFLHAVVISGCGYSAVVWQDIHRYIAATSNMANVGIMYYFYFAILLLNGLNCYWFYSIVKFATRALKVHPSPTSTSAATTAVTANDKARKKE